MKLPREQYLALKKFKREVNEERAGKLVRDRSGHLYRVNEDGSLVRCGRDDLLGSKYDSFSKEPTPGIKRT